VCVCGCGGGRERGLYGRGGIGDVVPKLLASLVSDPAMCLAVCVRERDTHTNIY